MFGKSSAMKCCPNFLIGMPHSSLLCWVAPHALQPSKCSNAVAAMTKTRVEEEVVVPTSWVMADESLDALSDWPAIGNDNGCLRLEHFCLARGTY